MAATVQGSAKAEKNLAQRSWSLKDRLAKVKLLKPGEKSYGRWVKYDLLGLRSQQGLSRRPQSLRSPSQQGLSERTLRLQFGQLVEIQDTDARY